MRKGNEIGREQLLCSCSFPGMYIGASGVFWCEMCAGLVEEPEKKTLIGPIVDQTEGVTMGVSCEHCTAISFYDGEEAIHTIEKRIQAMGSWTCPRCRRGAIIDKEWRKK